MSETPIAIEVNCETGEVTERPLTPEEVAANAAAAAEWEAQLAAQAAEEQAKAEARAAILAKLGLTEQEAALLLGN